MIVIAVVLFILCLFLLNALARSNPFDRVLWRWEYHVHAALYPHHAYEVCFTHKAVQHTLYKAVHHIMYTKPDTQTLIFDETAQWTFFECFYPFHFDTLDFSRVSEAAFNRHQGKLPCRCLILPETMSSIDPDELRGLHSEIVLPGASLVHPTYTPDTPVRVANGFRVIVPNELLATYINDPTWSSILLKDDNGDIVPVHFDTRARLTCH